MRIQPLLLAVAAFLVVITGASWYVGYANRTHPAPWPMAMGDAGRRNYSAAPFPKSPKVLWSYPVEDGSVGLPVAGVDGTIYLPWNGGVTAVGPDGKRRWTWRSETAVYSLALGRQGTVYALTDKTLYALGPDGAMQWQQPFDSGPAGFLLVGQGGVVYAQARSYLYAIGDNGDVKWRFRMSQPATVSAETQDGRVLVVDGTQLDAIKPDGDLAWQQSIGTVESGFGLMAGPDGRIYLRNRGLLVLNENGETVREVQEPLPPATNLAAGQGFVQDGFVRYGKDGSKLWAAERDSRTGFAWATVDSSGSTLLLQAAAARSSSPPPALTLVDPEGKVRWTFDQVRPQGLPAFTHDGRICIVGYLAGSQLPKLVCIGNE